MKVLGMRPGRGEGTRYRLVERIGLEPKALSTRIVFPEASNSGSPSFVLWRWAHDCCCSTKSRRALDPELVAEVLNIVRDLARDGMTMMFATHEMGFAKEVSSKVCFLHEGVIHEEGPPDQIFEDPQQERTKAFVQRIIDSGRL